MGPIRRPSERRRAAEELQALAADAPANDASGNADPAVGGATAAPAPKRRQQQDATAPDDAPEPDASPGLGRRLAIRIGVAAGAAALVLGVMAGWQLGQLSGADAAEPESPSAPIASPGPRLQADVLAAMPVAADTLAARVFLRRGRRGGHARHPRPARYGAATTPGGGPLEFRLLATRADGTRFFAARDGADLCLLLTFPRSRLQPARAPRADGSPTEGLRLGDFGRRADATRSTPPGIPTARSRSECSADAPRGEG